MRLSSVRVICALSCLLFAAAAWRFGPHSFSDFTAQAQTAKQAQLQPVSASIAPVKPATPELKPSDGAEVYTAKRGESIPTIARRFLGRTSYLTSSELADAIRIANHIAPGSNILKANQQIAIPGILATPITEKTVPVAKDFEVRAVYLTGVMAGSEHGLRIVKHWREVGGNSVVFDIKDSDGSISIPFEHPLVGKHNVYIHDVPKLVHFLHSQNMHAIARIAIFRDEALVVSHPELAVQSRKNKTAWRENGKLVWTDPSNSQVQDYDIALAKHVAKLGVDEIQFDYVRFPAEGEQKDAQFVFQKDQSEASANTGSENTSCGDGGLGGRATPSPSGSTTTADPKPAGDPATVGKTEPAGSESIGPAQKSRVGTRARHESRKDAATAVCHAPRGPQRSDVIAGFLKKAYAELHPTGVLLSLDVFGVMAWQRNVDLAHTGQDIVQMARYCDVLSPMIYPSHFFGMDNIAHPGDEPAHFIGESMDRFELITKGSGVVIRPWLQAFHWRTKTYSPEYIKIQVETAKSKGGIGFLFWNAANDYSKPFVAMPEMKGQNFKEGAPKDSPKYFRGDELSLTPVQASLGPASH